MDLERFQRLQTLFERARVLPPEHREELVRTGCDGDEPLRRQLAEMLDHHDSAESADADELLEAGSEYRSELADLGAFGTETESEDAPLPENVGRYRILGEIARGGFGVVLRGEDATIGRDVAVKILPPATVPDPRLANLLRTEGRIGGKLQHPAIVPVYELGDDASNRPFVAMKVVEGRTLASLLRERETVTHDRARFLGLFEHVCQAVAYAHARGVVHRDLKPQNVMIGEFGEVQVMDWGLAELVGGRDGRESVPVIGTPAYMAPEQARGEGRAIDPRCDVFGLGAILCEILTGAPPFAGVGTGTALEQARSGDLDDARSRVSASDADSELRALALRCLAGDPDERPADAREVAAEIRAFLESLDERARAAELEAAAARASASADRRARRLTTTLGLVVVLVTIAGAWSWIALENAAAARARVASSRLRSALVDAERVAADAAAGKHETSTRWAAAASAARNAERLDVSDADPELRERLRALSARVDKRLRDVRFAERLEHMALEERFVDTFDRRAELAAYRATLEDYLGRSLDSITVDEASEALAGFAYPDRILRALDIWAITELQIDPNAPREAWLREVASAIDDDPWRSAVRRAAQRRDVAELVELAESDALGRASSGAMLALALELFLATRDQAALDVLRRAHERFPDDFEVNANIAMVGIETGNYEEAFTSAMSAVALRPGSALPYSLAASTLSALDRHDEAVRYARRTAELAPGEFGPCTMAARVLLDAGRLDEAASVAERIGDTTPTNHATYPSFAALLGDVRVAQGRFEDAVEWYARAASSPRCSPYVPSMSEIVPSSPPELLDAFRKAIAARLDALGGEDAATLYVQARLDERVGRWQDALRGYEKVEALQPGFAFAERHAGHLRNLLGRGLVTPATIDEAIARLDPELPYESARRAVLGETDETDTDPTSLRCYAEARLLQRAHRPADAISWFEKGLSKTRDETAMWSGLHSAWREAEGPERADAEIRRLLAAGALPAHPLTVPPATPRPIDPVQDGVVSAPFPLECARFEIVDPRRRHARTRWQVRSIDGDFARRPALDVLTTAATTLRVPPGLLEGGREYAWRAAFVTDDPALVSAWSEEVVFRVVDTDPRAVPVDLSEWLTDDVVANPGDPTGDPLDPPNRYQLVVEGYDGARTDAPDVQGLPPDGRVGVHHLASYDEANSVRIRRDSPPTIRIPIPEGHHTAVLALVTSANGNAVIPGGILYDDGTVDRYPMMILDWFAKGLSESISPHTPGVAVLRRMDRMDEGTIEERNEAAIYQLHFPVDPGKRAVAFVIEPGAGRYDAADTSAHLFALTVMTTASRARGR